MAQKKKKILRSIVAIVVGFFAVALLSVVTDMILEKIGFFPPLAQPNAYVWWMLFIAFIYRTIFTVVGGYITAKLAPSKPVKHAVILGVIGMVFATLGTVANWDKGAQWYPILLILISVPSTWFGGKLQTNSLK